MDGLDFARKIGSGILGALVLGHLCLIRNLQGHAARFRIIR